MRTKIKSLARFHCPMPEDLDDGPHDLCRHGVACLEEFVCLSLTGRPGWGAGFYTEELGGPDPAQPLPADVRAFSAEVLIEAGFEVEGRDPFEVFDDSLQAFDRDHNALAICHAYRTVAERWGFDTSNQPELPEL